jgi:hypothetical protein
MPSEGKQRRNRQRNQNRFERNEELREQYPPFQSSSNNNIIHLHHLTPISTINELINEARQISVYSIDTESQIINGQARGALIQIQLVHTINYSTILITETFYLPNKDSLLFSKIKELYSIIFNNGNKIVTWGPYEKEFKDFYDYELIESGNPIKPINLQDKFQEWHNEQAKQKTHPARDRREKTTGYYVIPGGEEEQQSKVICDCGHKSHYDANATWSLQDAIGWTTHQFLDKSETINKWSCGLDVNLNTWRRRILSKYEYNPTEEKRRRSSMLNYASNDCLAVTELYFIIYPLGEDTQYETPPPTTTRTIEIYNDELSDISDDEIEISRLNQPKQQPPEPQQPQQSQEPQEQQLEQQQQEPSQQQQSKKEKQRKKNEKLKWKMRNLPHFQNKIKRPIYYKYDYRKIRAQLLDDNIFTNRRITINREYSEVIIGFKNKQELERATDIIKINYFSKNQYNGRWGN